jgi:hypothetical protein
MNPETFERKLRERAQERVDKLKLTDDLVVKTLLEIADIVRACRAPEKHEPEIPGGYR